MVTFLLYFLMFANFIVGLTLVLMSGKLSEMGIFPPNLPESFALFLGLLYLAKGIFIIKLLSWKRWAVYAYVGGVVCTLLAMLSLGGTIQASVSLETLLACYVGFSAWRSWRFFE